jgi:hypothetical protein
MSHVRGAANGDERGEPTLTECMLSIRVAGESDRCRPALTVDAARNVDVAERRNCALKRSKVGARASCVTD